ncbi:hypothetical protein ACWD4T_20515 [Streptomyces umbrinus]
MGTFDWSGEPDGARWAWNSALDRALNDPETRQYHDAGAGVLARQVLRDRMHNRPIVEAVLETDVLYRGTVKPMCSRRDDALRSLRRHADDAEAPLLLSWLVPLALACLIALVVSAPWWLSAALGALLAIQTYRVLLDVRSRKHLIQWLNVAWYTAAYAVRAGPSLFYLHLWRSTSLPERQVQHLRQEIARLLGPERESLLVFRNHRGLVHAQDPQFWVSTNVEEDLKRKLDQMDGGAIAICGPRGVGKSTLLRKSCEGNLQSSGRAPHFHVIVQTPANYKPEEFLISLFQQVCLRYLALYKRRARGPFVFRVRAADLPRRIIRSLPSWGYLLLGLAALVLSLRAPLEWLYAWGADGVQAVAVTVWHAVSERVAGWWTDHPVFSRMFVTLVGVLLINGSGMLQWPFGRRHRKLIADCTSYLHLLRHTQNASNATTFGLAGVVGITLGGSRTAGVSSRVLSYPELVTHFCELLTRISHEERNDDWKVFIGIDELDRLGSAEQAKAFLTEIKAIFTIPGVYFVLTVSEDIGAAFVRRGMARRDVTDSSLEDVHYIERRRLPEAKQLLQQRVPGFTDPFVALVHALAGGIPRDLIRYTRKLVEIRHRTGDPKLISLARHLLLEEIAQTLSAFRVMLGEHAHNADLGQRLHTLHAITDLAHATKTTGSQDLERIQQALTRLATLEDEPTQPADGETAQGGWEEASTYALFALTLLQLFAQPDFTERAKDQKQFGGADGDFDVLATIRLEMSVSPRSARMMMDRFRTTWGLEPHPNSRLPHTRQPTRNSTPRP